MSAAPSQVKALLDLLAAHKELSTLELRECQRAMTGAAAWSAVAAVGCLVGWLSLNAAVVLAFGRDPWKALCVLGGVNFLVAALAGLRARSLTRRPFFALTSQEAARDARSFMEILS